MINEHIDLANNLHWRKVDEEFHPYRMVEPSLSEIKNLYPGINIDFDYGLVVALLDYMKEIEAMFVYPSRGKVFISSADGDTYSLGEILLYAENIYQERLHN